MSKPFALITILLAGFLCAIWSPWNSWNFSLTQLLGVEPPPQIGGLQVTALAGEIEVFIDGESQGKVTTETSPLSIPAMTPGERQIRLTRLSTVDGAFWEFNRLIKFESGVDVVLSYELGPTQEFSEGHVIYATKATDQVNGIRLNLDSSVDGAKVFVDNQEVGTTPLVASVISKDIQHVFRIEKQGYETQEFKLLPDAQESRDKITGYNLNVIVDLFMQPITVR